MAERVLVLGGARSGKSGLAERLVAAAPAVVYVATGGASDPELAERVAAHRARRPPGWTTVETADLTAAVRAAPRGSAVLVDALGPWLADRMTGAGLWAEPGVTTAPSARAGGRAAAAGVVAAAREFWAAAAAHDGGPVVLVAEASGMGVTPPDPSSRRWLDLAGDVTAALAADADRVLLAVAGRALELPAAPALAAPAAPGVAALAASAPAAPAPDGSALAAPAAAGASAPAAPAPDGGDLAAHGDRMVPPGALDFAVNVHGDGPPPHLRAILAEALGAVGTYPDDRAARTAAAARHGRDPDEVLVTAGAAEAFRLVAAAVRARHAVVLHPQFTEPEVALRAAGTPVARVQRDPADGWALDAATVPVAADLVLVGNPTNPTGTLDPPERVAALCRPGRVVVVDEAFLDFVPDAAAASLAGRADLPGLVVVRSVTKLWGLPGLRAGYLVAPPGLAARLAAGRQPWPVSTPALAAVAACCADEAHRRQVAAEVAAARAALAADLAALPGVTVWPSAANFLLLRVPDGPAAVAGLARRGIAVRPSTFPGLDADHLRVAVRAPATNARLVTALADVLHADVLHADVPLPPPAADSGRPAAGSGRPAADSGRPAADSGRPAARATPRP